MSCHVQSVIVNLGEHRSLRRLGTQSPLFAAGRSKKIDLPGVSTCALLLSRLVWSLPVFSVSRCLVFSCRCVFNLLVLSSCCPFPLAFIDQVQACSPDATPEQRDAYAARIAVCFNAYYNVYVDNATLHAMQVRMLLDVQYPSG